MPGRVSRGGVRALKRVPLPALFCAGVKGWGLANSARCNRPCGRVYRGAAGGARGAHGENNTSPVSGCFSVGGNRPCGSVESDACRPRAALFGEQGFHADAVLGRSNRAAEGYGRVNGRGPPRQGHRCRDDVHLRLRRRGRRAERRGLLCAEKAVVAAPPRENGKLNEMPFHHKLEDYLDAYIEAAGLRGDSQGAAVPLRDREDRRPYGRSHVTNGCLAHGPPPCFRCRH